MINDIMIKAHQLSSKALDIMYQAKEKEDKAEECIVNEREEHAYDSRQSGRLQQKLVTTVDKFHQ